MNDTLFDTHSSTLSIEEYSTSILLCKSSRSGVTYLSDKPIVIKERTQGQTAVSISLAEGLLAQIDARAIARNLSRSQYLALLARNDIMQGSSVTLPTVDAAQPPKQVDLTEEAVAFLNIAIPALTEYEHRRDIGDIPQPPEPIADSELWRYFLDESDEILEYKWLESEKARSDIGMDRAIREWLQKHHALWANAQAVAAPPP